MGRRGEGSEGRRATPRGRHTPPACGRPRPAQASLALHRRGLLEHPRGLLEHAGSSSKDQSGPGQARGGFMAAARSVPGANAGGAPGASTVARLPGTGAAASNNEQGPAANAQACVPPRVRACVGTQSRAPGVGHSRMHGQRQGGVMARASFSGLGLTCAVCGTAWRGAIQRRRRAQ